MDRPSEEPSERLRQQRVRNRIIEVLELSSSFEYQSEYATKAQLEVAYQVVEFWVDWVRDEPGSPFFGEPIFSRREQDAIAAYDQVLSEVCDAFPDGYPHLEELFLHPEWQRLRVAAFEAFCTFAQRGKFDEEVEVSRPEEGWGSSVP